MSAADRGLQIVSYSRADARWIVHQDRLRQLVSGLDPTRTVKSIAVVGPAREGKSYLCNQLTADTLGAVPQRFEVGHRGDPQTHGLWAHARPHTPNGPIIVIIDVEGLGDIDNAGTDYDGQLIALVTLISSSLLFNIKGTLNGSHLQILYGVTKMVNVLTKNEPRVGKKRPKIDLQECRGPMPHLSFVIQNSSLQQDASVSHDEWLQEQLAIQETDEDDLRDVKQQILQTFVHRSLHRFSSPFPIMNPQTCSMLPTATADKWEEDYRSQLTAFKARLIEHSPTLMVRGNGNQSELPLLSFTSLVEAAVEVVNTGKGAHICRWPSRVLAPILNDVLERATKAATAMWASVTYPLNNTEMDEAFDESHSAAATVFRNEPVLLLGATPDQIQEEITRCVSALHQQCRQTNIAVATARCALHAAEIRADVACTKKSYFQPNGLVLFERKCDEYAEQFKTELTKDKNGFPVFCVPSIVYDRDFANLKSELIIVAQEISAEVNRQNDAEKERVAKELQAEEKRENARLKIAAEAEERRQADKQALLQQRAMLDLAAAETAAALKAKDESDRQLEAVKAQLALATTKQSAEATEMLEAMQAKMEKQMKELHDRIEAAERKREEAAAQYRADLAAVQQRSDALMIALINRPPAVSCCCVSAISQIHVEGVGMITAETVNVGDRVLTWDPKRGSQCWSSVYFVSVSSDAQPLLRITCETGSHCTTEVEMTWDHLIMTYSHGEKAPQLTATVAGEVAVGMGVVLGDGVVGTVKRVAPSLAPHRVATILTTHDTLFVDGVLCSCYDAHHTLGMLENMDLRLLYSCSPLWVSRSAAVRRYAKFCDDHVHSRVRQWLGFASRAQQISWLTAHRGKHDVVEQQADSKA